MTDITGDWESDLKKQIQESKKVLKIRDPKKRKWEYKQSPNYQVFQISPSRKIDGDNTYLISGTESQIILQASLIKALHDIFGSRLGYTIDFDLWFKDFSLEFKIDPITNSPRFLINKDETISFWGVSREERPSFEWITPDPNRNKNDPNNDKQLNYIVIKFYKNRKNRNDFVFVTGTQSEVRTQLIDLMRNESVFIDDIGTSGISESKLLSGFPEIKIKFWQTEKNENKNYRHDTVLSITLIGYGETLEENAPKTLDTNDLKMFREKIINLYYPNNNPFILQRGKETYSYQDWKKGYATFTHFKNQQNAIDVYQRLVQIKGDIFDNTKIGIGTKMNNSQFNDDVNITVPALNNKQVRKRNNRPVIDLQFWQAWVWLPKASKKIMLVNRGRGLPCDPILLE